MNRTLRHQDLVRSISRSVFVLFAFFASSSLFMTPAKASEAPKKVLIVSSEDHYVPAIILVNQSIRGTMKGGSPAPIQFFYEAQDSFRISLDKYEKEFVELLRRKYDGEQPDLIYALGPPALRFLLKYQDELFPKTPIVFVVTDLKRIQDLDLGTNVTGVGGKVELTPTLDIALALQPQTKQVVVVAGNAPLDRALAEQAQREFSSYESGIAFTYLIGLPLDELKGKLARLPERSVVFYLAINSDNAARIYTNLEVLALLVPTSSAPIYGGTQVYLGTGIVGGRLIDYEGLGTHAAEMGLRILAGESPQSIPSQALPSTTMFDWRALQRWGIDANKLPAGSVVRFRQATFWEQYKWRVAGAISLIILQALLIVGLLINRARRRRAEAASQASELRHRNVVETQTELICRFKPDTTLTFVNDAYCRHFGKTREELIGTKYADLIPEHARGAALMYITSLIENQRAEMYEHEVVLPNGVRGWQQWVDHVVTGTNGHGIELQGIGRDITEKHRAEEELRLSETRFRYMADTAPVMIWITDTNMQCTFFNQRALDFTGRSMEELLGDGWGEGVPEEDYQKCVDIYTAAGERKEPFVMEYRMRHADGELHWVYDTGIPRFASDGEFIGYIGSSVDITDRKTAEEAVQIAHEEVQKLKNQLQEENIYLQEEIKLAHNVDEIIGESNAIKYVLFKIEQVSATDSTVLILGETGTGKELVARAIHSQSLRRDRPLVKVNCAALSASLIESELFGHEKGAFTGASARKMGRFELADGATIFLDEVGELPLELQPKLLRVIQEGEFERLGSSKTMKVDVRIIAATNRNMKVEVEQGRFREDLWYRLNVFPITVPPLRQRTEDIPPMVEYFVQTRSKKLGKGINSIPAATLKRLQGYSWPGNVRELENVIERGVINSTSPVLNILDQLAQAAPAELQKNQTLEQIEREYITGVLDQTLWRVEGAAGAAKILGLNPSTLRTRMMKLGIQKSLRKAAGKN